MAYAPRAHAKSLATSAPQVTVSSPSQWRYFLYVRKSSEPDDRQVLSIESQKNELLQQFGHLSIVEIIEEAQSAKAPGRPRFESLMRRIEKGEAQGIIVWHPDRLARNSVDGGRVIYALDTGKLCDLKFAQYTFENTPEGKWMLGIIFGQSKYFVDKLSKDVKRGHRAKIEQGWLPAMAPTGYLNHFEPTTGTHTIVPDPERFALVRRMWDLMVTGAYTPPQIVQKANMQWGYKTRKRPHSGDKPLATSAIYRLFANPFYCGSFDYNGQLYRGRHEPMISEAEFWWVQELLGRKGRHRPQQPKGFAYTGMIRCGECGAMVTAEERWKRNKTNERVHHYVYYHCTKRKSGMRCSQPSIEVKVLETQMDAVLARIEIPEDFIQWALDYVRETHKQDTRERQQIALRVENARHAVQKQLDALLDLRLRELVSDEEFGAKRMALLQEKARLDERWQDLEHTGDQWLPIIERVLDFARTARTHLAQGTPEAKRLVLETVGSNLSLHDKTLHFEPVAPFSYLQTVSSKSNWGGTVEDVRKYLQEADATSLLRLRSLLKMAEC